jgi:hypothetical protein
MKNFIQALKELITGLFMACFSIPILICCVVLFEILDPFVRFYDALKNDKNKTNMPKKKDSW